MKKYLIISSFFLFLSCINSQPERKHNRNKGEVLIINPLDNFKKQTQVTDFIQDVNYLIPQIEHIIKIDNLKVTENLVLLIDQTQKSIYAINHDGLHLYTINNYGGAENEYYSIDQVFITENNIEVFDLNLQKRLIFNKSSGEWLKTDKINYKFEIDELEKSGNNYLISHNFNCTNQLKCHNFAVVDTNFKVISKHNKVAKNLKNYSLKLNKNTLTHKEFVYYTELFNDTIYRLNNTKKPEAFAFIDYGKRSIPDKIKYNAKNYDINDYITTHTFKGDYIFGLRDLVINDSVMYFTYFDKNKINEAFYSFNSGNLLSYKNITITDNNKLINSPNYSFKDYFVSVLDVEYILSIKNDNEFKNFTDDIFETYPDYDLSKNPIIVFYKAKP